MTASRRLRPPPAPVLTKAHVRPRLVTPDLGGRLRDFLAFRHLFRNIYGDELDVGRVSLLEARLPEVLGDFETQIHVFLDWMTGPLQANGPRASALTPGRISGPPSGASRAAA